MIDRNLCSPITSFLRNDIPHPKDHVHAKKLYQNRPAHLVARQSLCGVKCIWPGNGTGLFRADCGVLLVDQSFFDIFDYRLSAGDQNTALREPYSLVLTQSLAEKYFGAANPIGHTMTLYLLDPSGQGAPYKITGVMPDPPRNTHVTFNMLGSFNTFEVANPEAKSSEWRYFWNGFYTYVLLKEGVDPQAFAQKLPDYAERYLGEKMRELKMFYTFSLQPLARIHLHSDRLARSFYSSPASIT